MVEREEADVYAPVETKEKYLDELQKLDDVYNVPVDYYEKEKRLDWRSN